MEKIDYKKIQNLINRFRLNEKTMKKCCLQLYKLCDAYFAFLKVLPIELQLQFTDVWNELNEFYNLKQYDLVINVLKGYLSMVEKIGAVKK